MTIASESVPLRTSILSFHNVSVDLRGTEGELVSLHYPESRHMESDCVGVLIGKFLDLIGGSQGAMRVIMSPP